MTMRLRYGALCAVAIALPGAVDAAEKRASAEISTSVGYSNNPFSTANADTGSAFVEASVRPQLQILAERSTITIAAAAQLQQYLQRYSRSDSYQGSLDYRGRHSEHVRTHLKASFMSSIVGSLNDFGNNFVDPGQDQGSFDPTQVPDTVGLDSLDPIGSGTDIGLFGSGARRRTINVGGDVSFIVSQRDQLTASAFYNDTGYSGANAVSNANSYYGFGGSLGYARQLSQYTQVGLQSSAASYVYDVPGANSKVYSLQATLTTKFNSRWSLSGGAGVSFVNRAGQGARAAFSGNATLCRTDPRATACLSARRAIRPTGFLGAQTETNIGASYRYRLSERSTVGFTGNYIDNGSPLTSSAISSRYVQATSSYERQLRQRLRLFSSAHYRKIFGGSFNRASDFGGQIGIAIRFGNTQ